jgi:hypothetical protein
MPDVDTNAPVVTNSDAAMWRQDHGSAIRYIEALQAEVARLTPLAETGKAVEGMVVGGVIERYHDETRPELRWSAFAGASSQPYYDEVYEIMAVSVGCAKTIQEAVAYIAEEDAALQAAIAEDAVLAATPRDTSGAVTSDGGESDQS